MIRGRVIPPSCTRSGRCAAQHRPGSHARADKITQAQATQAIVLPLALHVKRRTHPGAVFRRDIRKYLEALTARKQCTNAAPRLHDAERWHAAPANQAIRDGLHAYDRRHGCAAISKTFCATIAIRSNPTRTRTGTGDRRRLRYGPGYGGRRQSCDNKIGPLPRCSRNPICWTRNRSLKKCLRLATRSSFHQGHQRRCRACPA